MSKSLRDTLIAVALSIGAFLFLMFVLINSAIAHDIWISQQGLRNAAGEWCCGAGDCFVIPSDQIKITEAGYALGNEVVPYHEAQPSPDGAYWRCKRPDGSRRCFFAPPPGA